MYNNAPGSRDGKAPRTLGPDGGDFGVHFDVLATHSPYRWETSTNNHMSDTRRGNSHSPLPPQSATFRDTESVQASQQLLRELTQAAEAALEGMVSTRGHDHALRSLDKNSQPRSLPSRRKPHKRKREDDWDLTPSKTTKESPTAMKAVAVVVEKPASTGGEQVLEEYLRSAEEEATEQKFVVGPEAGMAGKEQKHREMSAKRKQKRLANRPKSDDLVSSENTIGAEAGQVEVGVHGSLTRLDDDDLNALMREESEKAETNSRDVQDQLHHPLDSDDDAPEEARTGAGHDHIGSAASKAAAFAAKDAAVRKAKRRDHEQRMKAQAEGSKKHGSGMRASQNGAGVDDHGGDRSAHRKGIAMKGTLPALLPDEILNAEPTSRAPALSTSIIRPARHSKKKLPLDTLDRPPKDLIRGTTKIRILQDDRMILPPKSSIRGRTIREKWLMGQRGPGPSSWVPRRKQSMGFVRKPM
ncbi:MAG: hypothetical protein Q9163_000708 [Psora crenata]